MLRKLREANPEARAVLIAGEASGIGSPVERALAAGPTRSATSRSTCRSCSNRWSGLVEVWRDAWADLEAHRREREGSIRKLVGDLDPSCNGDPFRLGQGFRNLFDNALAASANPVEISIRCEPAQIEGRAGLRVVVRDNGLGLDAEQSANLFEPFYTTKTKGTSLGLATSRRIVEAYGASSRPRWPSGAE